MGEPMQQLRQAITAVALSDDDYDITDGMVLGDFVIVAHWPNLDGDNAEYTITSHDKNAYAHSVIGLLHLGIEAAGDEHD